MPTFEHLVSLAVLRVVCSANSTRLQVFNITTVVPAAQEGAMTNNATSSFMVDRDESGTESSDMVNETVFSMFNDGQWSEFYGSRGGQEGPTKICPGRSFITKWTFHAPTDFPGGVQRIGQVECSGGRRLPCCDGRKLAFQSTDVFDMRRGFTRVTGNHDPRGFSRFKVCFNGRCSGRVNSVNFDYSCPRGSVLAGYKARFNFATLRAIQFFCRRKSGFGGGEGEGNCGKLLPLPRQLCPRDHFKLAPCFTAGVNKLCRATGRCRRANSLRNCQGRSVYLKI